MTVGNDGSLQLARNDGVTLSGDFTSSFYLKAHTDAIDTRLATAEATISSQASQISALQSSLSEAAAARAALTTRVSTLESTVQSLETRIASLEGFAGKTINGSYTPWASMSALWSWIATTLVSKTELQTEILPLASKTELPRVI